MSGFVDRCEDDVKTPGTCRRRRKLELIARLGSTRVFGSDCVGQRRYDYSFALMEDEIRKNVLLMGIQQW